MAWRTSYSAGSVLTAADMNAIAAIGNTPSTYTPAWTANTTNPSLGNGTRVGRFWQAGKLVHVRVEIVAGSTTTFGSGFYIISLPVAARTTANSDGIPGSIYLLDASAGGRRFGGAILQSSTSVRMFDSAGNSIDSGTPWAWASGDQIILDFFYEAA